MGSNRLLAFPQRDATLREQLAANYSPDGDDDQLPFGWWGREHIAAAWPCLFNLLLSNLKMSKDQQQGEEAALLRAKCEKKAAASQGRKKRIRTAFTSWQLAVMEAQFQVQQYLVGEQRVQFATQLGLNEVRTPIEHLNPFLDPSEDLVPKQANPVSK